MTQEFEYLASRISKKESEELKAKLKREFPTFWKEENGTFTITAADKLIAEIKGTTMKFISTQGTITYNLCAEYAKGIKEQLFTDAEAQKTLFKELLEKESFNKLKSAKSLALETNKRLKAIGIQEILPAGIDTRFKTYNRITLTILPQLTNYPIEEHNEIALKEAFPESKVVPSEDMEKEKIKETIIPIELLTKVNGKNEKTLAGKYFKERNLIALYYNPFESIKAGEQLKENQDLKKTIELLETLAEGEKITLQNSEITKMKIASRSFNDNLHRTQQTLQTDMKHSEDWLTTIQKDITQKIRSLTEMRNHLERLKSMATNFEEEFIKELQETKKLDFIQDITFEANNVVFKYKPHTQTVDFKYSDAQNKLRTYGKRTFLVGQMDYLINATGINIRNNHKMGNATHHMHQLSSGENSATPCMGSGEGYNLIMKMLATNQIKKLAMMLYSWQQTWNQDSGTSRNKDWIADRLRKGLPVWDEKGNRITLNEKARLESGEQPSHMDKHQDYEKNIEQWKDFKPTSK